jgi:carbamoyltransferase
MYILGLNDGIHDAAACLVRDGILVAAAEEERFIRIKHPWDRAPWYSARFCLEQAGITLDDVDYVVTPFVRYHTSEPVVILSGASSSLRLRAGARQPTLRQSLPEWLFPCKRLPVVAHVNHHLAHAASAFRCSGWDRAGVLVVDGRGESVSSTIAVAENNSIRVVRTWDLSQSLGFYYEALTRHVGLGGWGEGKTMGLAGWGTARFPIPGIRLTDGGYEIEWPAGTPRTDVDSEDCHDLIARAWRQRLRESFGAENASASAWDPSTGRRVNLTRFSQNDCDIAASGQRQLEQIIEQLARVACAEAGVPDLVLAGGVALNCAANGRLITSGAVKKLFVQPAANDAGTCIGAALELWAHLGNRSMTSLRTAALGPGFGSDAIRILLESTGASFSPCSPAETAAGLLAEGYVIGWFQGRMEMGPRALGQRSILANPNPPGIQQYLNEKVKHREYFRPFALSIAVEDCPEIFERWAPSPHMLMGFPVVPGMRQLLSGGVHVDGTTRPQTVDREDLPLYWSLIDRFKQMTGVPGILNTSFNDEAEPIVCTPSDALRTFFSSPLDFLVMGDFLVAKERKRRARFDGGGRSTTV